MISALTLTINQRGHCISRLLHFRLLSTRLYVTMLQYQLVVGSGYVPHLPRIHGVVIVQGTHINPWHMSLYGWVELSVLNQRIWV